jgi:hypothetical protein
LFCSIEAEHATAMLDTGITPFNMVTCCDATFVTPPAVTVAFTIITLSAVRPVSAVKTPAVEIVEAVEFSTVHT